MSSIFQVHKGSFRTVLTGGGAIGTQVNGDVTFMNRAGGRDRGHKLFLAAGQDGSSNNKIQLYSLKLAGGITFVQDIATLASNLVPRGIAWNGHRAFVVTRNTNNNRDQVRVFDIKSGNQISTNGIGNVDPAGCCYDGRSLYVLQPGFPRVIQYLSSENGVRFRFIQGFTIANDVVSICFDGKGFFGVTASGEYRQYCKDFSLIRNGGITDVKTRKGLMTDGNMLYSFSN